MKIRIYINPLFISIYGTSQIHPLKKRSKEVCWFESNNGHSLCKKKDLEKVLEGPFVGWKDLRVFPVKAYDEVLKTDGYL